LRRNHELRFVLGGGGPMIDLAKCGSDPRTTAQLDGIDSARWHEFVAIWRELALHDRISLLNFARELKRGGESARTIGLGEALAEVDRVIGGSQSKHPNQRWRTYSAKHHQGKMLGHVGKFLTGERNDQESGLPHLAHMAARALMLLAIALEEDKHR
jgi:hypothetical protein